MSLWEQSWRLQFSTSPAMQYFLGWGAICTLNGVPSFKVEELRMVLELVDCLVALREQSHLTFCDASTDGITGFVSGCRNWKERPIPSIEPKRIFAKSLNPGMAELGGTPDLERTTGAKMELGCLNHRSRINSVNDVSTPFCYLTIAFHLSDTKTTNNCSFSVFSFFRKIAFSKDATIRRRKDCWDGLNSLMRKEGFIVAFGQQYPPNWKYLYQWETQCQGVLLWQDSSAKTL